MDIEDELKLLEERIKNELANYSDDQFDIILPNSSIAVHGVSGRGSIDKDNFENIAQNITLNGLNISKSAWGGFLSNCQIIGDNNFSTIDKIKNYDYCRDSQNQKANIVIALPQTLVDENGEEYFLGSFPEGIGGPNRGDDAIRNEIMMHPLYNYFSDINLVPTELIVGYYYGDENNQKFVTNPNYLSFSIESQYDLLRKLKSATIKPKKTDTSIEEIKILMELNSKYKIGNGYYNQLIKYIENKEKEQEQDQIKH